MLAHLGQPLVDVRSPDEYSRRAAAHARLPAGGRAARWPHPRRASVPWARAAAEDGTFKPRAELEAIYDSEQGLSPDDDVIAYCRIGERSSHTWFVLTHLLGYDRVRNYDGCWTEWGNTVRVPIDREGSPSVAMTPCPRRWPSSSTTSPTSRPRSAAAAARAVARSCPRCRSATPSTRSRWSRCTSASHRCSSRSSSRTRDGRHLFFSAPREAPTTRGFAGIMHTGLDGEPAADVLAVPDDFYRPLGLAEAVSPLRLRGCGACSPGSSAR